jgi:endonuclease-3
MDAARQSARRLARRVEVALRRVYGAPERRRRRDILGQLIGTILSQNTSDANSSRAGRSLRGAFPSWADVLNAPTRKVADAIRAGGLADVKAPRIREILARINEERGRLTLSHLGRMMDAEAMEYLLALGGVGPKTAACVLLFGMGRDVFPVDTHVYRLCVRLGLVPRGVGAERAQALMADIVPRGLALSLHVNMIRHGRLICKPQRPLCRECVLGRMCPSRAMGQG